MKIPGFPSFSHENQLAVAARTAAAAQHAQQGAGWA